MMRDHRLLPALAAILLLLAGPTSEADLGLELDQEAFENAPTWQPAAGGFRAVPRVDLSGQMPVPGQQGGYGSCTGWAVAYAMKTAQEVVDQGWRPDHPSRVFSPAFVWNQLNGGENRGCSIADALALLQRMGCATWERMPYRDGGLADRPTADAVREASNYRIREHYALRTAGQIKEALQSGHPVVVGIRCDSDFMEGAFPVWTRERRKAGEARALADGWDGQHRNHAMVVVGYDDTRRAFKLMNSWGREWGRNGFCWVSYDLMQRVPNAPFDSDELFLMQAWIAQDVRRRVGGTPPPPAVFEAHGEARYAGIAGDRPTWLLTLFLTGSDPALDRVRVVAWQVPAAGGRFDRIDSADRAGQFAVTAPCAAAGNVRVYGDALLDDGASRRVTLDFRLDAPSRRVVRLVQSDRYLGRFDGTPNWEWTVRLEGDAVDLADVAEVTYHLHPTFPNPDRTVGTGAENGFALTSSGWGTFRIGATVRFRDGTTSEQGLDLRFDDPVRDELTLRNSSRYSGVQNGQHWWQWTAFLDGPLALLRRVRRVTYHLHPSFPQPVRPVEATPELGFPMSTSGWGTFGIRAVVEFDDGSTRTLVHDLEFEPLPPGVAADGPPSKDGGIPGKK